MSTIAPHGLHHVTAIASDPQRNVDFYTEVLGLRLVKTTVNFDDPGTFHLYYGDEAGHPSTILTVRGRRPAHDQDNRTLPAGVAAFAVGLERAGRARAGQARGGIRRRPIRGGLLNEYEAAA